MSVSLAAKPGSRERLKVRSRCGCNLCARQMRCTEPNEIPMALAIVRPVQWVASCDGSVQLSPHYLRRDFCCDRRLTGPAGPVAQQAVNPALSKRLSSPSHRRPADPNALCHPLRRVPLR